ncbi:hypothetical protein BC831DRAFT_444904 [Entophlyctis helioformis]|nr:hypothetical protein BC831DRAFT_444904 [Entophlyctis helioformis]
MAKVARTPVAALDGASFPIAIAGNAGGGGSGASAGGEHPVKFTVSVDYALCKVQGADADGHAPALSPISTTVAAAGGIAPASPTNTTAGQTVIALSTNTAGVTATVTPPAIAPAPKASKKKRHGTDEYKRLYISYSLGGQVEGKEFIGNLYQKPTEFVIWEIVRSDDRDKEGPQSLRKQVPNMGITPVQFNRMGGGPGTIGTRRGGGGGGGPAGAKAGQAGTRGQGHGGTAAHTDPIDKLPMSLAQTGLTRHHHMLHQQHLAKLAAQKEAEQKAQHPHLGSEEAIDLDPHRPRPEVIFKSRMAAEAEERAARDRGDHLRLGQDLIDNILHRLHRRQSSSTPDLSAALREGIHDFRPLNKRTNSDSPPLDRFRPGSPLHRFLTDDFGVGQHQHAAGGDRPTSRASTTMRESPHPHHFNHPEKHMSPDAIQRGLVRSRSSSSLASLHQMPPKTPPSPHHFDHPLNVLAPHGRVRSHSQNDDRTDRRLAAKKDGKKDGRKPAVSPAKSVASSPKRVQGYVDAAKHTRRDKKRISQGHAAFDDKHIRWDAESQGVRTNNWTGLSREESERRANDQTIEMPHEKLLLERKKGEYTHVPLGRIILDVTGLFFDVLETKASVLHAITGLERCDIGIKLDTPLLSHDQAVRLNPMCITIVAADGMPNEPLSYAELDEKCLPVSAKFRLYSDPFIHTATLHDQPHAERMVFDSQHLILTGMMEASRLRDDFVKAPFTVEIHDRDHRLPNDLTKINADLRDDGLINSSMNPINPYGVASFSLSGLCAGQTHLHLSSPILPARAHVTKSKRTLPSGLWLESSANLTISLELRFPLISTLAIESVAVAKGAYGHVVIVTNSRNGTVAKTVQDSVTRCSADTLKIPAQVGRRDLALATYQLTDDQKRNPALNILTGYDIFDGENRVYFIEGLVDSGIPMLLTALDTGVPDKSSYRVWHSQATTFNHPAWNGPSPGLLHVMLDPDLSEILADRSTYIRDRLSKDCFDCLHLIQETIKLDVISVQARMAAFPTQRMIFGLLAVYGRVVQFEDSIPVGDGGDGCVMGSGMVSMESTPKTHSGGDAITGLDGSRDKGGRKPPRYGRRGEPVNYRLGYSVKADATMLDQDNVAGILKMQRRHLREPNFVAMNRKHDESYVPEPFCRTFDHEVYNYSMQTQSTTQEQLYDLRARMAEDKTHYYAYCLPYFSQMVSPVDVEDEEKRLQVASMKQWKTRKGFWAGPFAQPKTDTDITPTRREELQRVWEPPKPESGMILRTLSK